MLEPQQLAADTVAAVLRGRNLTQALQALWKRHSRLTPQQRAAIQDMSYGALRHYGQLQVVLDALLRKPLPPDDHVRELLLVALYQLIHGKSAEYAVVDHAVKSVRAMKKPWAEGLVNAVLRNFLRQRDTLLAQAETSEVARYSHPQWWIDKLRGQYPDDWAQILQAGNSHPPMTLRVNLRLTSVPEYLALLQGAGIEASAIGTVGIRLAHPVSVEKLPGFETGWVSVQDFAAQYAAPLLDVHDGMRVLDACSAPGGKAAHLLESARLELTALDKEPERLQKVADNLRRLQLSAQCLAGDAAEPDAWWDGRPYQRILADVPCSASGVASRHPDIKWLRRESDVAQFAAQQARILQALWRILDRGGKLLYVTCSVFAEENRLQIAAFLAQHPDAAMLALDGFPGREGQLLPDNSHDGFYYALLSRN